MTYPKCPRGEDDKCRFYHLGGSTTCMHSPIVHDRKGNPVGGGGNTVSRGIGCTACNSQWSMKCSELELAQGKGEWKPVEGRYSVVG